MLIIIVIIKKNRTVYFVLANTEKVNFLGIALENTLTWKSYKSELSIKLHKACYVIRVIKPFV